MNLKPALARGNDAAAEKMMKEVVTARPGRASGTSAWVWMLGLAGVAGRVGNGPDYGGGW